jgi:hypothetical protein
VTIKLQHIGGENDWVAPPLKDGHHVTSSALMEGDKKVTIGEDGEVDVVTSADFSALVQDVVKLVYGHEVFCVIRAFAYCSFGKQPNHAHWKGAEQYVGRRPAT